MKKKAARLYKIMRNLKELYIANEEKIQENPFTYALFGTVLALHTDVTSVLTDADKTVAKAWQDKDEKMEKLFELADICFKILRSYGRFEEFAPFMNLEGCAHHELVKSREEEAFVHIRKMVEEASANTAKATEAGLSLDMIPNLMTALGEAEEATGAAIKNRTARHKLFEKADELISKFTNLLYGSLIDHMDAIYEKKDPVFHHAFQVAIVVPAPVVNKIQLRGRFTNEEGEVVRRVSVAIDGEDATLHGGEQGGYTFRNLEYGVRQVRFSCPAYHTQIHSVVIKPDDVVVLDVQFVAVSEEHPEEDPLPVEEA